MADLLGIGTAINAGVGGIKSIFGGIQAIKGRKQLNTLLDNRPQYNISQGYLDSYKTYQSLANSNLPGYDIMKGQIDQSGAKAMTNLERGAMGSNQYMSGALQSQDKELEAIKNLGLMSAQWRGEQQQNLAKAQGTMGQLQDTAWDQNVNQPWQIKANMASERQQTGQQNLYSGLSDIGSSVMNFAGTSSYMKALQQTQGKTGVASSAFTSPSQGLNEGRNSWANWANPNFKMPKFNYTPVQ
jgi:hypothetical protein